MIIVGLGLTTHCLPRLSGVVNSILLGGFWGSGCSYSENLQGFETATCASRGRYSTTSTLSAKKLGFHLPFCSLVFQYIVFALFALIMDLMRFDVGFVPTV